MIMYICPKCKEELVLSEHSYKCRNGHCFDISAKGYVNLLMSGKSGIHGDNKDMLIARRDFLSLGHYSPIIRRLAEVIKRKYPNKKELTVLDAGCGEGYYTGALASFLSENGYTVKMAGIDVSKDGVAMAAKRYKQCDFAVASVNSLPFPDSHFDAVVSLFAPIAEKEFYRVLKPTGTLITVSPSPRHLYGLKSAVYANPYENEETTFAPELFCEEEKIVFSGEMILQKQSDINNLFKMTPYYYKTNDEGRNRAENIGNLRTEIGFMFYVFKRT